MRATDGRNIEPEMDAHLPAKDTLPFTRESAEISGVRPFFLSQMRRSSFSRCSVLLLTFFPLAAHAQAIPELVLAPPAATLKDGLKSVSALRELADGRVLIVDSLGERLVVADLASGKVETRMKTGSEDDEFRLLGNLWAWPGDSVAAPDHGKARINIFAPDGTPVRVLRMGGPGPGPSAGPPPNAAMAMGGRGGAPGRGAGMGGMRGGRGLAVRYLFGTDRLVGTGAAARVEAAPNAASAPPRAPFPIVRLSLRTMRMDTVARLMGPQAPRPPMTNTQAGTWTVFVATTPLQSLDTWAAMSDGTVAVVRAASYRIEWYAPNGERSVTDSVPYTPIPVTSNDKKRVVDDYKRIGSALLAANPQRTAILAVTYAEPQQWPAVHPPFRGDIEPVVDPEDRIWLATRCAADDGSMCYDVVDRIGERVARYRVPPKTRVAGFGKGVVYTAVEQKSDKEVLHRHPLN